MLHRLRPIQAAYVAGTPEYLAPAASGENQIYLLDNVPGVHRATVMITWNPGEPPRPDYDKAGRVEANPSPNYTLSFRYAKGPDDDYRYYQYLKGKFGGLKRQHRRDVTLKTYHLLASSQMDC